MARQGLSRLLVAVAMLAASAAWLGFTLQRTVFEPARSERVVRALLDSPDVRNVLVQRVVDAVDASLPPEARRVVSAEQLASVANTTLDDPGVRTAIEQSLVGTQRYLIGDSEVAPSLDTALIDAEIRRQLTAIRPDLAAVVPTLPPLEVNLPAQGVEPIRKGRDLVDQATPLLALAALSAAVAALVVSSRRPRVLRQLGSWAIGAGALWVVLRFALPAVAEAVLPSSAAIAASLSEAIAGSMAGPGVALALVGVGLWVLAGMLAAVQRQAANHDTRQLAQERAAARQQRKQAAAGQRAAARASKAAQAQATQAARPAPNGAAPGPWPASDDPRTYRPPAPGPGAPTAPGAVYVPKSRTAAAQRAAAAVPGGPPPPPPAGPYAAGTMAVAGPAAAPVAHAGQAPAGAAPAGAQPPIASSPVFSGGGVVQEYAPTISIPLPRRERDTSRADHDGASRPAGNGDAGPQPGGTEAGQDAAATGGGPGGPPAGGHQPGEWLGGFSMDPTDHDRIADPAPPPPRWIEGVGYVYEYAPTPSARWIDGLGYVLADD